MTTIGKQQRKFIEPWKSKLPGVGSYNLLNVQARKTQGGSFTRATRSITEGSQVTKCLRVKNILMRPGPGSYSLDLKKREKVMSFPHSRRFATDSGLQLPGPADYKSQECSKDKIKAGIICKSARKSCFSGQKAPGPSDYRMPDVTFYKKREPTTMFGKAKRALDNEDNSKELLEQYNSTREGQMSKQLNMRSKIDHPYTHRQSVKLDRAWHGRRIERQARVVEQDRIDP